MRILYAEIRTVIWSAERVRTPWAEYGCSGGNTESKEPVYGLTLSAAPEAYVKHGNHFQNWAADRGGSVRKFTDTVRIHYAYSADPSRMAADRASGVIRSICLQV